MQATVIERPPARFVGLRLTAPFETLVEAQNLARKSLLSRQYEISGIIDAYQQLGVTRPNETESAEDVVTTYLGFEVTGFKEVPKDMVSMDLKQGKYAQFLWKGSMESDEFDSFYPSIFGWLQQQSLAPSQTDPWIEIYGKDNDWEDRSNPENQLTVLLPLGGPSYR